MRLVSAKAIACVIALGGLPVLAVQTTAQTYNQPAPAPTIPQAAGKARAATTAAPQMTPAFRAAAGPVQKALEVKDFATARAGLGAAEAAATLPYEKYVVSKFKLQVATNINDVAGQETAIDALIATGQADPVELPSMYFFSGNFAYLKNDFAKASTQFEQAVKLGYDKNDIQIKLADSYLRTNRLDQAFAIARQQIAARKASGQPVPDGWYSRPAAAAQKAGRRDDMFEFLAARLENNPSPENWRNTTAVYRSSVKADKGLALDAFRLMSATNSLKSRDDYFEYAAVASDSALPGESYKAYQAGLNAKAFTSTDTVFTALGGREKAKAIADKASLAKSEADAAKAATGNVALGAADGYLGHGDYAKAATLYRLALQKGGIDAATASTRLGIALAMSGDKAGATAAFGTVTGSRATLARLWTIYVNGRGGAAVTG